MLQFQYTSRLFSATPNAQTVAIVSPSNGLTVGSNPTTCQQTTDAEEKRQARSRSAWADAYLVVYVHVIMTEMNHPFRMPHRIIPIDHVTHKSDVLHNRRARTEFGCKTYCNG